MRPSSRRLTFTQSNLSMRFSQDLIQKRIDSCLGVNWGYTFITIFASMVGGLLITVCMGQSTKAWLKYRKEEKASKAAKEAEIARLVDPNTIPEALPVAAEKSS